MKLFVLTLAYDHEGEAVCGVYTSRKQAKQSASLLRLRPGVEAVIHPVEADAAPLEGTTMDPDVEILSADGQWTRW